MWLMALFEKVSLSYNTLVPQEKRVAMLKEMSILVT